MIAEEVLDNFSVSSQRESKGYVVQRFDEVTQASFG